MPEYVVEVNATSNGTINTEDTFVEINGFHKVKKVTVRQGDGTETVGLDNNYRVRVITKTVVGATGVAGTENPREHGDDRAAGIAALVKNGTSAFTVGTVGRVLEQAVRNAREHFTWEPENGYVTTRDLADGRCLGVIIQCPVVSKTFQVTVVYEE